MTWLAAFIVKPILVFGYAIVVAFLEVAVKKWLPESKIKRMLLRRW